MVSRHTGIYLLFLIVVGAIAVFGPRETHSAPAAESEIPTEAMAALRDGRYLRASLLLREYLAASPDSSASAILLAARAEAGWGDWERVNQLLEGRAWLDQVASGYGWSLLGRSQLELGRTREGSASLARYLSMADSTTQNTEQGVAQIRRAEALGAQGQHAAGVAAYDAAAELLPQVADWIHIFAAAAASHAGDTAAVRVRLADADPMLAQEWAWRVPARAHQVAGDLGRAVDLAERAAARVSTDARRAAAWTTVAELRRRRGDSNGARAAYIRAMNAAAGSSAAIDAARGLSEMGALSPQHQLLVGRVYLRHGNFDRGIAGVQAYIDAGAGTAAERAQLKYDIANAFFRAGEYQKAERALLAVAAAESNRKVIADALYTAARAQYRDGRSAEARATLQHVIRKYSDQSASVRAAYLTADLDHDDANLAAATEHYRLAIRLAPTSDEAGVARMRLGGIAFAEQRFDDALREFDEYRNTHRSGRAYQQATYWSARALRQLGRDDDARARLVEVRRLDPFAYYGGLAALDLDEEIWQRRLEPAPPPSARFELDVGRALARVDLLRTIGWDEAATFEMERVRRHFARFDGALYSLAEALNDRGFTNAGISLGWDIYRREGAWNPRLLRIVYPFPFRSIIMAEAGERGVDPFLAAALIRQESMFNPRARSPVGALGLMQVMPRTGQDLAGRLGIRRFKPDLLLEPEVNIHFGMAYLADQLRAYGNRLDAVLAAYNAGPGRVTRWQQFPEYADRTLFAERIPYDETRDYVRIVQNNRRIYAALYGLTADAATAVQ